MTNPEIESQFPAARSPLCFICESAGANTPGTGGTIIDTGQGVCPTHVFGALMMGYGVHVLDPFNGTH